MIQVYDSKNDNYIQLPLTEYIKGVVAAEIGSAKNYINDSKKLLNIYKVQAIASKGFGLWRLRNKKGGYYVFSTTLDQKYKPLSSSDLEQPYKDIIIDAVSKTKDEYITCFHHNKSRKEVIYSAFRSGWMGYSSDEQDYRVGNYICEVPPYLKSKKNPLTQNQLNSMKNIFDSSEITKSKNKIGLSQWGAILMFQTKVRQKAFF